MNSLYAGMPTTIFDMMSGLARDHQAINLGQGFPDDPGPKEVREKAADAVLNGWNQYPPMMGLPELREAIAAHYQRFQGLTLDPARNVMVTSGATEALADSILSVIEPGDEVILFQPMYDAYLPLVLRAGGVPRFVDLDPSNWSFSRAQLEQAFNTRTRAVVFNNPHNPCGVVYPREQIELLAEFCIKFGVVAICDEVWEHLIFDGRKHVSMYAIPGMEDLTIKISSAGKIFSLTGWKIGLVAASAQIMTALSKAHQFNTFTTAPNLQLAVAHGLNMGDDYFAGMRADFQQARDYFCEGMNRLGFPVEKSDGTYFVVCDIAKLGESDDFAFCQRLVKEFGVAAIPVSAFYAQDHVRHVVRFCFAKRK
ncbi:MAG: aminotransferase, partial [Alphaproteobacteria bacterium]|nr:aminotransferase [Alphaproteobacteria bacterium]